MSVEDVKKRINKQDDFETSNDEFVVGSAELETLAWTPEELPSDERLDEENVEFFSLKMSGGTGKKDSKGSKRFDDLSGETGAVESEDQIDFIIKSEIEQEEVVSKIAKDDKNWDHEGSSDLNFPAGENKPGSMSENFEADMLLIEAHDELDADISEADASNKEYLTEEVADLKLSSSLQDEQNEVTNEFNDEQASALSLKSKVEAILFAAPKPMKVGEVLEILGEEATSKDVSDCISELVVFHKNRAGGFILEAVRGGYQFQSVLGASGYMQRMFTSRPRPISRAAQETLAIIAYRQPVTRADIEFIRGVDAGSIVKNLLDRGLIRAVGRKEDAGRPILFGTTEEFLMIYGLQDLDELPPLESFQPSSDTVKAGMDLIDEKDKPVFDGDFIGDHDKLPEDVQVDEENIKPADGLDSGIRGASQYELT